ncbi:aminotransferase class V-fold PLP-dependent enzyme [Ferrimonas balearica]|uniref:aminotransferase class V-fold PLP-dependent enzyme n=1 Tax=Ferrimonas balearica TaxID=44012 RepID=UPI001C9A04FA|nr:aminotransferase class V-fold PLP-dependent enzyme [Ferrimonas balearica]MBY5922911.1 aminotransferase class V-fold PLP-dependent enzyme [Ferrimonas balearica]MBY5997712.1 aminotransferase class V-fold PLP-dependent enzyme [Ferrimonas balearica]
MSQQEFYLDSNATTVVLPPIADAVMTALTQEFGNPSSSHVTGIRAKARMERTRALARQVMGAENGEVIFTSGATEGIQTAVISALQSAKRRPMPEKPLLLYGATEHKAVPETLKHWARLLDVPAEVRAIPVDHRGRLDLDFIAAHVDRALMVCTMAVNNETGCFQDLRALEQVIRTGNPQVPWMVDCVQALGKLPLALSSTTIDYAPFSGHKLYAPKGIGWLYVREGAGLTPVIAGGGQEGGLRSGTENGAGIAALEVLFGLMLADDSTFADHATLLDYRAQLVATLTRVFPDLVFNQDHSCSVPTTLNFSVPGFSSKELMDLFDAAGIRVSSGSACSSKVTRSFVLDAMGLPAWQSESAIRLSFGPAMTAPELKAVCERIDTAVSALATSCLLESEHDAEKFGLKGLIQFKAGSSCCWLYVDPDSDHCVVVDPVDSLNERLERLIRCQDLTPVAILDTHGHADHVSSGVALREALSDRIPPFLMEVDALGWPNACGSRRTLADGQVMPALVLGESVLVRVPLPGHTDDSVGLFLSRNEGDTLLSEDLDFAFCGDTILMGSLGRTNFSNSQPQALYHSLNQLSVWLSPDTLICPSHDYHHQFATSLAAEQREGGLLAQVLSGGMAEEAFLSAKAELDRGLCDQPGTELMCGATPTQTSVAVAELSGQELCQWRSEGRRMSVLDIREPHEFALSPTQGADNVPLSRLVNFMAQQRYRLDSDPVVLICRSGSRSLLASQSLRRLGINNILHVAGGHALS